MNWKAKTSPTEPVVWPQVDLKPGDFVQKSREGNNGGRAWAADGIDVRVVAIVNHQPDGSAGQKCVALLADHSWEFVWNLHRVVPANGNGDGHVPA